MASQGLSEGSDLLGLGYAILVGMCFFLLVNLILHVLLRGVWISTVGLRYVSGDIDFESLKLAPKFDKLLRRKLGSFDQYILKLENLCSVVFAFTFLIVFMLMAVGLYFFFMLISIDFVISLFLTDPSVDTKQTVASSIAIGFLLIGLVYLIDFMSLGYLKRVKWLSHVYVPIYRVMSTITLSFLYRPI